MGNTIVTEPVYLNLADGRTILAASPGDELTEKECELYSVGSNGKSSNGVTPPDSLRAQMENSKHASELLQDETAAVVVDGAEGYAVLNAKDATKHIGGLTTVEQLDEVSGYENAREDGGRKSVFESLDKRYTAIGSA